MSDTHRVPQVSHAPRKGDAFVVDVGRLDDKGAGVATWELVVGPDQRRRQFEATLRGYVPGDRVAVEVVKRRGKDVRVVPRSHVAESALRIAPRCASFSADPIRARGCGGCALQMLDYQEQLRRKEARVARAFSLHGLGTTRLRPIRGMKQPWFYRNKMEFSFGVSETGTVELGLHPAGYRYDVISPDVCHLLSEPASRLLDRLRQWFRSTGVPPYHGRRNEGALRTLTFREGKRTGDRLVELTTTGDTHFDSSDGPLEAAAFAEDFARQAAFMSEDLGDSQLVTSVWWTQHIAARGVRTRRVAHHLAGEPALRETLHLPAGKKLTFDVHPHAFFQPNTLGAEALYGVVLDYTGLLDRSSRTVLDLYCGTGTIALAMAPYAQSVVGIELVESAVDNAIANAKRNDIHNATFFAGDVADVLSEQPAMRDLDVVVVDPPRSGLSQSARDQVVALGCERLVYVSCNPDTLARDCADLASRGFKVVEVQPVDMFPQTYHVENVALLTRIEG